MAVEVLCPDCGGVIGATDVDANGRGPCTCAKFEPAAPPIRSDSSDTVSIPSAPQESAEPAAAAVKLCIACGKNLSGHRRVKDSRGYMCYECAKSEIKTERDGLVQCAECGKRLKEAGLVDYEGIRICKKCFEDHKEIQKKVVKKVAVAQYDKQEKKSLIIMGIVLAILGTIILLKTFVFK